MAKKKHYQDEMAEKQQSAVDIAEQGENAVQEGSDPNAETQTQVEAPAKNKSIVDPKYRKKEKDWLGTLLTDKATKTKTVTKTIKDGDKESVVKTQVADGIDVDALFTIAEANNINVDRFKTQRGMNGFPGRFRMTLRNMLQTTIKQRHGLFIDGDWLEAPEDWLVAKAAPEAPTHDKTGKALNAKKTKEVA